MYIKHFIALLKRIHHSTRHCTLYVKTLIRKGALVPQRQARPIQSEHLNRMKRHLSPSSRAVMVLAYKTASRAGEVARFTRKDFVTLRPSRIVLNRGIKTESTKVQPFRPDSLVVIEGQETREHYNYLRGLTSKQRISDTPIHTLNNRIRTVLGPGYGTHSMKLGTQDGTSYGPGQGDYGASYAGGPAQTAEHVSEVCRDEREHGDGPRYTPNYTNVVTKIGSASAMCSEDYPIYTGRHTITRLRRKTVMATQDDRNQLPLHAKAVPSLKLWKLRELMNAPTRERFDYVWSLMDQPDIPEVGHILPIAKGSLPKADLCQLLQANILSEVNGEHLQRYPTRGIIIVFFTVEERDDGKQRRFITWPEEHNRGIEETYHTFVPVDQPIEYTSRLTHEEAVKQDLSCGFSSSGTLVADLLSSGTLQADTSVLSVCALWKNL